MSDQEKHKRGRPLAWKSKVAREMRGMYSHVHTQRQLQNLYFATNAFGEIMKADLPGRELLGAIGVWQPGQCEMKKMSALAELGRFGDPAAIVEAAEIIIAALDGEEAPVSILRNIIRKHRMEKMNEEVRRALIMLQQEDRRETTDLKQVMGISETVSENG